MVLIFFPVFSGREGELDLSSTCQDALNHPPTDLAAVILDLLGEESSHTSVQVLHPIRL